MAYLISLASMPNYWTGKESAVWSGDPTEAKEYATKKEADKEIKDISEAWGYTLKAVKSEEAVAAEVVSSEPVAEEPAAE